MKSKRTNTTEIANEVIGPAIDYAAKNRGTMGALAERLSARLGYKVHRQLVQGWLHPDPERRIEPKLGLGLVILAECRGMMEGDEGISPNLFFDDIKKLMRKARNGS